jgi:hypothetical protein
LPCQTQVFQIRQSVDESLDIQRSPNLSIADLPQSIIAGFRYLSTTKTLRTHHYDTFGFSTTHHLDSTLALCP